MNRAYQSICRINKNLQLLPKCKYTTDAECCGAAVKDVPGLSKKMVDVPSEEVGYPGASKTATYKNPEYFSYHMNSFYEAEVEMNKYRLPQPSNKPPQQ